MGSITSAEVLVLFASGMAIIWVNWFFLFSSRRSVRSAVPVGGVQEVRVVVEGGYDPANIRVRAGEKVRLVFDRRERAGCSEEVVIPEFGVKRFLPAFQETVVEFTPSVAGSFEFTCGMAMLRGRIIVEDINAS